MLTKYFDIKCHILAAIDVIINCCQTNNWFSDAVIRIVTSLIKIRAHRFPRVIFSRMFFSTPASQRHESTLCMRQPLSSKTSEEIWDTFFAFWNHETHFFIIVRHWWEWHSTIWPLLSQHYSHCNRNVKDKHSFLNTRYGRGNLWGCSIDHINILTKTQAGWPSKIRLQFCQWEELWLWFPWGSE